MQNDIKNKWSIFALLSWLYTYICILRKYIVLVFCFPRICLSFFHSSVCLAGLHLILFKWYIVVISMYTILLWMDIEHVSGFGFCITDSDATGLCALVLVSLVDSKEPNCWVRALLFLLHFLFYTRWHHWNSCD